MGGFRDQTFQPARATIAAAAAAAHIRIEGISFLFPGTTG